MRRGHRGWVVIGLAVLAPGTYTFWCSVEEHHSLGMTGTLVVEP